MLSKKKILKYIGIVILVKIIVFSLFFIYSIEETKKVVHSKKMKIHEIEVVELPKKEVLSQAQIEEQKERTIKYKLEDKMKAIYKIYEDAYTKNKSKKAILKAIKSKYEKLEGIDVFIADYNEKTLYGSNDYKDVYARTIVLEEIQKVRRKGSGFIISDLDLKGKKRYVILENLKRLNLYVGINFIQ